MILARERYGKAIDQNVFPGFQGGPLMHVIAAKAVCFREAATPEFVNYQKQVIANAQALAPYVKSSAGPTSGAPTLHAGPMELSAGIQTLNGEIAPAFSLRIQLNDWISKCSAFPCRS